MVLMLLEALWFYLKKLLQQALDHLHVPKLTLRCHHHHHQWPKWFTPTPTLQHQLNHLHTLRRKYSKKQDVGQFKEESNDNKAQQYEWLYIEGDKRGHFSSENSLAPWAMLFILLPIAIIDLTWVQNSVDMFIMYN